MTLQNLRQKMLISLGLGLVVVLALSLYADLPKLAQAFGSFQWWYLAAVIPLTVGNYLLRFVKWHYYLHLIGAGRISVRDSFLVFFSGLSMVVTPGKVGEWLKCFLLKEVNGTPISVSAPIVVAERLTDGIAMLLLAAAGLVLYSYAWQVMLLIFVAALALIIIIQWRSMALRLLALGERFPLISKRVDALHQFYESSYLLLRGRSLFLAVGIGLISWFGECAALFFVLVGLGIEPSPTLLLQATFVLATSTVIASVAFLPGGLGVAEGSITGMLLFLGITSVQAIAVAATLLIRAFTLWFGVVIGVVALFVFSRQVKGFALDDSAEPASSDHK